MSASFADHTDRFLLRAAWETVRLAETISHAYNNTLFYRKHWDAHGVGPSSFNGRAALSLFPALTRADIASHSAALMSAADPADNVRDTSGTTGARLPIYMNSAEEDAMAQLKAGRARGHPTPRLLLRILSPPRRLNPIVNRETGASYGTLIQYVHPGHDLSIWYDAVDQVLSVLLETYYVGTGQANVDVIHTTPPPLFWYITQELINRGIDAKRLNISEILLTGGPLFSSDRRILTDAWNAALFTAYSCTEVRGEAMQCPLDPAVYHPSPCMVAEVLDPRTLQPVEDGGIGEIALTGLYPFQRCMPMIRYRPGDLARLSTGPCKCGSTTVGIKILGRVSHAIDLSDLAKHSCILGTYGFFEAIGDIPQVPKFPYPHAFVTRSEQNAGPDLLELKVEAANPRAFDATAAEQDILQRLRVQEPDLAKLELSGDLALKVTLTEKNALPQFYRLYPGTTAGAQR